MGTSGTIPGSFWKLEAPTFVCETNLIGTEAGTNELAVGTIG